MADKTVSIRFRGKDDTRAAFGSVQNNLRGLSSQLGSLRGPFAAISGIAAGLGLTKVFSDAVEATREYEQSTLKLDAVMKATGGTVGFTREQLEKSILAMERDTIFAQNEIRDATSIMATFKSIQGETFTEGMELAADMAAVMDQSLKSSVVQLGKALEDPIRGLSSLREVGVSFTAQQEEMIKSLVESGEKMQAQGLILKALEGQFGGTAAAQNEGLFGAMQSVREAYDRLLLSFGKSEAVEGVVVGTLNVIADGLERIDKILQGPGFNVPDAMSFLGGLFAPQLGPTLEILADQLNEVMRAGEGRVAEGKVRLPDGRSVAEWEAQSAASEFAAQEQLRAQEEKQKKAAAEAEKKRQAEARMWHRERKAGFEFAIDQQERLDKATEEAAKKRQEQVERDFQVQLAFDKALKETAARREQEEAREREALIQRTLNVLNGLNTEQEALRIHTQARLEVLQEARDEELITEQNYQWQKERLREQHAKQMIAIEDAETKKRWQINQVYRKLDLESSQFFFAQLGLMMESGNRKMFEIGKAGAIAETLVNTYRAAQGAYAALAGIPFVGPALGIAAAAAAVVAGVARVEAIRGIEFGGGAVAAPTFNANPSTGLPTDFGPNTSFDQSAPATERTEPRIVNITLRGDSGMVSTQWIRDELIPSINEAVGDGAKVLVN